MKLFSHHVAALKEKEISFYLTNVNLLPIFKPASIKINKFLEYMPPNVPQDGTFPIIILQVI